MKLIKKVLFLGIILNLVSCAHYRPETFIIGSAVDCLTKIADTCCKTEKDIGGW
jgi:hypothetical protein